MVAQTGQRFYFIEGEYANNAISKQPQES